MTLHPMALKRLQAMVAFASRLVYVAASTGCGSWPFGIEESRKFTRSIGIMSQVLKLVFATTIRLSLFLIIHLYRT